MDFILSRRHDFLPKTQIEFLDGEFVSVWFGAFPTEHAQTEGATEERPGQLRNFVQTASTSRPPES